MPPPDPRDRASPPPEPYSDDSDGGTCLVAASTDSGFLFSGPGLSGSQSSKSEKNDEEFEHIFNEEKYDKTEMYEMIENLEYPIHAQGTTGFDNASSLKETVKLFCKYKFESTIGKKEVNDKLKQGLKTVESVKKVVSNIIQHPVDNLNNWIMYPIRISFLLGDEQTLNDILTECVNREQESNEKGEINEHDDESSDDFLPIESEEIEAQMAQDEANYEAAITKAVEEAQNILEKFIKKSEDDFRPVGVIDNCLLRLIDIDLNGNEISPETKTKEESRKHSYQTWYGERLLGKMELLHKDLNIDFRMRTVFKNSGQSFVRMNDYLLNPSINNYREIVWMSLSVRKRLFSDYSHCKKSVGIVIHVRKLLSEAAERGDYNEIGRIITRYV